MRGRELTLISLLCLMAMDAVLRPCSGEERLRLVVETDAPGGDSDDEGSLVRFFMYLNEWDVEGMFATRPASSSRTGVSGEDTIRQFIDAYGTVRPHLLLHASGWPTADHLRSITRQSSNAGDLMIAILDRSDPRPIWYTQWGTNDGQTSALRLALDWIKANRSSSAYQKAIAKLRYVEVYKQNHLGDVHRNALPFYMDTFWPDLDGGRWYHRFRPLTETAGGFSASSDIRSGHGPLCARYTITKEGDTMTFTHLIPNGLHVPGRPDHGGWSGRYRYGAVFSGVRDIWANDQRDSWRGSANRDNTLERWTVHLQNDFRARADWCVATTVGAANHQPQPLLQGTAGLAPVAIAAAAGSTVTLSAAGSTDPDGDSLSHDWTFYREAGTYDGAVAVTPQGESCTIQVPTDAAGTTLHVILITTDDGSPALTRYRRAMITVGAGGGNTTPIITAPASDSGQTATTVDLTVAASDADGDTLNYTWAASVKPSGSEPVIPLGASTTASFDRAGSYTLTVTVSDGKGGSTTSSVDVVVAQVGSGLQIAP